MDPIRGTDISLALAQIAIKNIADTNDLQMAQAKLVLDTVKDSGAQIVQLLENLGRNIDVYA